MKHLSAAAFVALLLVQIVPAAGLAWQHAERLRTGQPILLAVETRDPRDLFRGEYSTLTYEIGNLRALPLAEGTAAPCAFSQRGTCGIGPDRRVFVRLAPDAAGVHRATELHLAPPPGEELVIAGRIRSATAYRRGTTLPDKTSCEAEVCLSGRATYDIERWYGPQGRPAKLDASPRASVLVEARVDRDGAAVLDGIRVEGRTFAKTARLW